METMDEDQPEISNTHIKKKITLHTRYLKAGWSESTAVFFYAETES